MSGQFSLPGTGDLVSRRSLLSGGAAAAALAALPACDSAVPPVSARQASTVAANVRVSRDRYGDHVGPSLAANPLHPRQLLAACQGSPFTPEFIVTYRSVDAGASWQAARSWRGCSGFAASDGPT
jgi:hypothetical protein